MSRALLALALLPACASTPAAQSLAPASRGPTQFPIFQGTALRPVWLERADVNERGLPIVNGPTRANMDSIVVPYTDLPIMELAPCNDCGGFDIRVTRVEGRGTTTHGPGGAQRMESSRTLPSVDGIHRFVEWWIVDQVPHRATLDVTRVVGVFDPGTRTPTEYTRGRVDAVAIEGGALFAFRTCEADCDELVGSSRRVERVTLVGPGGAWSSSSDDPRQTTYEGDFIHVTAQVQPNSAESVTVNYSTLDAARFTQRESEPLLAGGVTTVMLDVVWVEGEMPELSVYRGFFLDTREAPDLRLPGTTTR